MVKDYPTICDGTIYDDTIYDGTIYDGRGLKLKTIL
jgi:hypothetical protein